MPPGETLTCSHTLPGSERSSRTVSPTRTDTVLLTSPDVSSICMGGELLGRVVVDVARVVAVVAGGLDTTPPVETEVVPATAVVEGSVGVTPAVFTDLPLPEHPTKTATAARAIAGVRWAGRVVTVFRRCTRSSGFPAGPIATELPPSPTVLLGARDAFPPTGCRGRRGQATLAIEVTLRPSGGRWRDPGTVDTVGSDQARGATRLG
jgi:hypothetical protein